MKQGRGFTVVELLIVIVVIAILAAISIVSYIGIQDRAKEVAVQSDLSNFAKVADLYFLKNGSYPIPAVDNPDIKNLDFEVTQSAYTDEFDYNFDYCTDRLDGNTQYILVVKMNPSEVLYVSSNNSDVKRFNTDTTNSSQSPCYNTSPNSAATEAGLTGIINNPAPNVGGGISGYRPAGWAEWTR